MGRTAPFLFLPPEHHRRARRDVDFEPSLALLVIEVVVHGEMLDRVISQTETTVGLVVGVESHGVLAFFYKEAIVFERLGGIEVEYEEQRATLVCEDLVAVIVPDLDDRCALEHAYALDQRNHRLVKISQIVIAQIMIVDEIPLAAGILV